MTPNAGKADFGGPKEREGMKGNSPDDLPLRDGHNEEPDVPSAQEAMEEADLLEGQDSDTDRAP